MGSSAISRDRKANRRVNVYHIKKSTVMKYVPDPEDVLQYLQRSGGVTRSKQRELRQWV